MKYIHTSIKLFIISCFCFFCTPTISAQTLKSYNVLGEMILRNQISLKNPTYQVPCGTVNTTCFFKSAITVGDAVQKPLSYFSTAVSTNYYVNYSLTTTTSERGKSFRLTLTANKNLNNITSAYAFAFADWNRDGVFETVLGKKEITELSTKDTPGVSYDISIPADAALGKTRIRIYLSTNKNLTAVNPTDAITGGFIYDFEMFIAENTGAATSALLSVTSNNLSWGTAIVKTESPTSDGKYPLASNVTVQAIKANLSDFVGWSNGSEIVSTEQEYTFAINGSVYLIAVFKTLTATLENPQTSSVESPIWYQIKNAQTDTRLNRFIAYDVTIPAGYISALRIEKPEDFSNRFLWRLSASANGMVKLINRGTNKQIAASTGALNEVLSVSDIGSDFMIESSGNANASFSVKYLNAADKLLNGGMSFNILLYNAGIGSGSGWYFYRVPTEALTAVKNQNDTKQKVYTTKENLCLEGMESGTEVSVYNLLGHLLSKFKIDSAKQEVSFSQKGIFVVLAQNLSGQSAIYKVIR